MTKKLSRWKPALLFALAAFFAVITLVSFLALVSVSGIGAGLIVLAAAQLTINPIVFVTLTTCIGLGLTALTAAFAVYDYLVINRTNQAKKDAPKPIYMSRPAHLDTPHLEWVAKRNQLKELLLKNEDRTIYANIPTIASDEENEEELQDMAEDEGSQFRP
jgi:hypothetical protein